jgi:hypothetical protein
MARTEFGLSAKGFEVGLCGQEGVIYHPWAVSARDSLEEKDERHVHKRNGR